MINIREATTGDAGSLANLATQLGYTTSTAELEARFSALLPGQSAVLVAESGNQVAGFAHVAGKISIVTGSTGDLRALVVDEAYRGCGVGRRLLRAAEEWAVAQGCDLMDVSTSSVRTGAHAFYRRQGYEQYKTSLRFRRDLL